MLPADKKRKLDEKEQQQEAKPLQDKRQKPDINPPLSKEEQEKESFEQTKKAAKQGDAPSQFQLGLCYEGGKGVDKDLKEAIKWYQKAADQGYAAAQFNLGVCYKKGSGVEQNQKKAVEWYQKAADQGYAAAQFNLGVCYKKGAGVDKNPKEAIKWYQKATDQGYVVAQCNLAGCYYNGIGVNKDQKEAVYWYQKAANQGYAVAQYNLGICYEKGSGVGQDQKKSAYWYQKAAKQGFSEEILSEAISVVITAKNILESKRPNWKHVYQVANFIRNRNGQYNRTEIFSRFCDEKQIPSIEQCYSYLTSGESRRRDPAISKIAYYTKEIDRSDGKNDALTADELTSILMSKNCKLTYVRLQSYGTNGICLPEKWESFINALQTNTTLEGLDISSNPLTHKQQDQIRKVLAGSKSLHFIKMLSGEIICKGKQLTQNEKLFEFVNYYQDNKAKNDQKLKVAERQKQNQSFPNSMPVGNRSIVMHQNCNEGIDSQTNFADSGTLKKEIRSIGGGKKRETITVKPVDIPALLADRPKISDALKNATPQNMKSFLQNSIVSAIRSQFRFMQSDDLYHVTGFKEAEQKQGELPLKEFLKQHTGVCRHQALLTAIWLGDAIIKGLLPAGKVRIYRGDSDVMGAAHSLCFYHSATHSFSFIIDPAQSCVFDVNQKNELKNALGLYGMQFVKRICRYIEAKNQQAFVQEVENTWKEKELEKDQKKQKKIDQKTDENRVQEVFKQCDETQKQDENGEQQPAQLTQGGRDKAVTEMKAEKDAISDLISLKNAKAIDYALGTIKIYFNKPLGNGGFGKVYDGTLQESQLYTPPTPVAIKVIEEKDLEEEKREQEKRFQDEVGFMHKAEMAGRSQFIVEFKGYSKKPAEDSWSGSHPASYLILMELMSGGSLRKTLVDNQAHPNNLSWSLRLQIAREIAEGLNHLHLKAGIIHCDLSSNNVLLTSHNPKNMHAKLSDFGLSKDIDEPQKSLNEHGTLAWMAPEFLLWKATKQGSNKRTKASDIYSYGVILWELLTYQQPYKDFSEAALYELLCIDKKEEPIPNHLEQAYPQYCHLIRWCRKFNPEERPSITEVISEINRIQESNRLQICINRFKQIFRITDDTRALAILGGMTQYLGNQLKQKQLNANPVRKNPPNPM